MISGANYREGLAINSQGAVYVYGLATAALPPAGSTGFPGADPNGGKIVTKDGELVVRFR